MTTKNYNQMMSKLTNSQIDSRVIGYTVAKGIVDNISINSDNYWSGYVADIRNKENQRIFSNLEILITNPFELNIAMTEELKDKFLTSAPKTPFKIHKINLAYDAMSFVLKKESMETTYDFLSKNLIPLREPSSVKNRFINMGKSQAKRAEYQRFLKSLRKYLIETYRLILEKI